MPRFVHSLNISLMQGSALDKEVLRGGFADLLLARPPAYTESKAGTAGYVAYLDFSEQWLRNCLHWAKEQARLCLHLPLDKSKDGISRPIGADLTSVALRAGWQYKTTIIWHKTHISQRTAWGSWQSAAAPYVIAPAELVVVCYKGEWKKSTGSRISDISAEDFACWTKGVWTFDAASNQQAQKTPCLPRELARRCMLLFSYQDDTVFDPFARSGDTLLLAQTLQRRAVGLEQDEDYFEQAKKNISRLTDK